MKRDIHPKYYQNAKVTCSCGNTFSVGATVSEIRVEVCSACHPYYTGTQKFIDTAGRVDKFQEKMRKAEEYKEKLKAKNANGKTATQKKKD